MLLTVEIPALLGRKYELNAQQQGIQFVAAVIGATLGEIIAGRGSDLWMQWRTKRAQGNREPEMRLPFSLPGFVLALVGILVFGIQLQNTKAGVWVRPSFLVVLALGPLAHRPSLALPLAERHAPHRRRHRALRLAARDDRRVRLRYRVAGAEPAEPGTALRRLRQAAPRRASPLSLFVFSPAPRSSLTSRTLQFVAPFYLGIMYEDLGSVSASGILAALSGPLAFLVRPLSRSPLLLETLALTLVPLARSSSP